MLLKCSRRTFNIIMFAFIAWYERNNLNLKQCTTFFSTIFCKMKTTVTKAIKSSYQKGHPDVKSLCFIKYSMDVILIISIKNCLLLAKFIGFNREHIINNCVFSDYFSVS